VTTFERQKSAADFRFQQTSYGVISEPPSNNIMVKKNLGLAESSGKYRQFSVSAHAKILTFHQTALSGRVVNDTQ
jgi:hypothetical protein